jgi:hypothetical protein
MHYLLQYAMALTCCFVLVWWGKNGEKHEKRKNLDGC